jgi:hypothetical protein
MAKGKKTGGRVAGTPNKVTASAKECIEKVAQGLGGPEGMLKWAQSNPDNERVFWGSVYPKLLPKDVELSGPGGKTLQIVFDTETVKKTQEPK